MNAIKADFTATELETIKALGYGVVTLENQIVDRGLLDNIEMGIMTNGGRDGLMKSIQEKFLADGWQFKASPIDGTPVNGMKHTILVKDGFQISFYSMDARVEVGSRLVESRDHYLAIAKSTWE